MNRNKPLRRTKAIARGKALAGGATVKPRRQARPNPELDRAWRNAVIDTKARSRGRCEARCAPACTGKGEHRHHVILRAQGGPDEAWNLLDVCHLCHDWIHKNVGEAKKLGLIRSRAAR